MMNHEVTGGIPRQVAGAGWLGAVLAAALLAVLGGSGCSVGDLKVAEGTRRSGIDFAVGNVDIGPDCTIAGDVSLKAGNLTVAKRTVIEGEITVTHGNVDLAAGVTAAGVRVSSGVIELADQVRIDGPVSLKQGWIAVGAATITGPCELHRGRLEVGQGAWLSGGIEVKNRGDGKGDSSAVYIAAGARVTGTVAITGPVRLTVSRQADVGEVEFRGIVPRYQD